MKNDKSLETTLDGILDFYSETGTEGGLWAFQDSGLITPNTTRYSCRKCRLYWDKEQQTSIGLVHKNISADSISDYLYGEICSPNEHQFELFCPENWSYEGLHILENGDRLTIYHPDSNKKVWSGKIALKSYPLFTEHAFGWWIHADQIGVERNVWAEYFFKNYPAELIIKG